MTQKCIRCGAVYEDNDDSILRGCKCGSIFFLYMRKPEDIKEMKQIQQELQAKDINIEQILAEQIEEKKSKARNKKSKLKRPKIATETIKVQEEGVYKINLDALMRKRPLVILERSGVYIVHLLSALEKVKTRD